MGNKIKDIREMIEYENKRAQERLTILVQFQGLLFTALSLAWDKNRHLILLIAIVGIISSFSIGQILHFTQEAFGKLVKEYDKIPKEERDLEGPVVGIFAWGKNKFLFVLGRIFNPTFALPALSIAAWIFILIIKSNNWK
jgi:hypothetical protein